MGISTGAFLPEDARLVDHTFNRVERPPPDWEGGPLAFYIWTPDDEDDIKPVESKIVGYFFCVTGSPLKCPL